jgi:hypothetical protein
MEVAPELLVAGAFLALAVAIVAVIVLARAAVRVPAAARPRRRRRGWRPEPRSSPRFGLPELAHRLGLTPAEVDDFRPAYREIRVPKRSGGERILRAPDDRTKALQRRILRRLLARLPVHPSCHGFERGRSIATNAGPHAGRAVVLHLDIRDFFGATSPARVRRLYRVVGWDREAARILTRLTTYGGGLPQGAPTSPSLANLVNVLLDARLSGLAAVQGAVYTRYADDLTFSWPRDDGEAVRTVIRATKRILRQHGYELHEGRKLRVRRRYERQLVTGLVVNRRVALPRWRRRWLRSVEHHLAMGRPATLTRAQLTGWHAFELMLEGRGDRPSARPPTSGT